MAATSFNTSNDTYRQIVANGLTYRVPHFQRDYSWREEEWDDLWHDLIELMKPNGEPFHYMGYLVLQSKDDRRFDVIDGQQRLTTLSLIVLAVLKSLGRLVASDDDADRNELRVSQLRNSYVGYLDPVTLVPQSKLVLNRNNDRYYQTWLVTLTEPLPMRGYRESERQLRQAFLWFDGRIQAWMRPHADKGEALARFVETMSDRLFFTVIKVADELNAYKVFETLNARGVRLSVADLLKNYLFSVVDSERQPQAELNALEDRWEAMTGRLAEERLSEFVRVHWNSRRPAVRQSELFKAIRQRVKNRGSVFELLREMEEDIEFYLALTNPESSELPVQQKSYIQTLRLFGVRQPFSLLLAAQRRLTPQDVETLLRAIVVMSFRFNVIGGRNTGDQESAYQSATGQIATGELVSAANVLRAIAEVYPSDAEFKAEFAKKVFTTSRGRNAKIVRYVLGELEQQASHQQFDFGSSALSIEHIASKNPEQSMPTDTTDWEGLIDRLGNLTLLETPTNREVGNSSFEVKRQAYANSQISLTREIAAHNSEWTPERIDRRQQRLAELATAVWRVAQLS